jgi:hypothetical protein
VQTYMYHISDLNSNTRTCKLAHMRYLSLAPPTKELDRKFLLVSIGLAISQDSPEIRRVFVAHRLALVLV